MVVVLLAFADPAAVDVGTVQVSLTTPEERNIAIDETNIFPTTSIGAGRQDGPILLKNEK